MNPRQDQKTVLITGCTPGGIGHALALEFHSRGLHVIATARRTDVLEGLAAKGMTAVELDVTKPDSIARCLDRVSRLTSGKLDILLNNAGRTHTIPATDISIPDVRETFETNVFGVMAMVQAFAPLLIAAKGLVINIASLSSVTAYTFGSVYAASKGAIVAYSRALRHELRPFDVGVMVAMTGTVRSEIASKQHRSLPPDSLYLRVRDVFERRLVWSQNNETVPTEVYARQLVSAALRRDVPSWVPFWARRLFGRPDWHWAGGLSRLTWWGTWIGEWVVDMVCWRKFQLYKLADIVKREAEQKKLR